MQLDFLTYTPTEFEQTPPPVVEQQQVELAAQQLVNPGDRVSLLPLVDGKGRSRDCFAGWVGVVTGFNALGMALIDFDDLPGLYFASVERLEVHRHG